MLWKVITSSHLPHPEPAVPGAGDDGVSVGESRHGRHPVRVLVTGVLPVTLLHLRQGHFIIITTRHTEDNKGGHKTEDGIKME